MRHHYHSCASVLCTHLGYYTCPDCGKGYCFDHCVGHGCGCRSSTPTVAVKVTDDAQTLTDEHDIFRPWLWDRLHVALHAVGSLDLYDAGYGLHLTLYVPVIGSSLTGYTYMLHGFRTRLYISPPALTLEDLVRAMPEQQRELLATLLDLFVARQRAARGQATAGQPVLKAHADAVSPRAAAYAQNTSKTVVFTTLKGDK